MKALILLALIATDLPVKKTISSGICHTPSSRYYCGIKHYESYPTLVDCINSGGKTTAVDKKAVREKFDRTASLEDKKTSLEKIKPSSN